MLPKGSVINTSHPVRKDSIKGQCTQKMQHMTAIMVKAASHRAVEFLAAKSSSNAILTSWFKVPVSNPVLVPSNSPKSHPAISVDVSCPHWLLEWKLFSGHKSLVRNQRMRLAYAGNLEHNPLQKGSYTSFTAEMAQVYREVLGQVNLKYNAFCIFSFIHNSDLILVHLKEYWVWVEGIFRCCLPYLLSFSLSCTTPHAIIIVVSEYSALA